LANNENLLKKCKKLNVALVQPCKHLKNVIENDGDGRSIEGMYQIPEVVFSVRKNLLTSPFHPFIEKFQHFMDLCFEAGLPSAWEKFHYQFLTDLYYRNIFKNNEEKEVLDFREIAPIFGILLIGFSISLLTFLIEIFYHDFLKSLSKFYFKKLIFKKENEKKKVKVRRVKVRSKRGS
jgi:hypothetical protein